MSTGRAHEKDTLFLGPPANYAAKKVADSDEEGIFLLTTFRADPVHSYGSRRSDDCS